MVGGATRTLKNAFTISTPGCPDQTKRHGYIKTDLILNETF